MKKYIKPSIEVVKFDGNYAICAGSPGINAEGQADTNGTMPTGDAADAMSRPTFGIWDDED